MPEIEDECIFIVQADQTTLSTKTNGDSIQIAGLHLNRQQAAALAYIINSPGDLKINIKVNV
ncbi:hypothetical protein LCGC14_1314670 [marine sediment metagenome]|uniref:Uncharacterized protein n=1 Tax=marine sediment metagenome TaxID=412755 RepID=A0A0F9N276_9ZZZZ